MLNIWKKSWKEREGTSYGTQLEQDSTVGPTLLGGGASHVPILAHAAAIPPSDGSQTPASVLPLDEEDRDPPEKRRKLASSSQTGDSLSKHLPELREHQVDHPEDHYPLFPSDRIDRILDQVKRENTIATLPSKQLIDQLIVKFLTWTARVSTQNRSVVVVVEDGQSAEIYAHKLRVACDLSIAKYTNVVDRTTLNQTAVFIVPAIIFCDLLAQHILSMSDIHSLIICDAQNVKDQDAQAIVPVARLMTNFYPTDHPLAPRVLVLAHFTSELWQSFDMGILNLEKIFHSRVFGISPQRRAEILSLPDEPSEVIVLYNAPTNTVETKLMTQLKQLDPEETFFRRHSRASRLALTELGPCAADLVWRRAQKDIEQYVNQQLQESNQDMDDVDEMSQNPATKSLAQASRFLDTVKNWAYTMPNLDPSSRGFNVTSKFLRLTQILRSCQPYGNSFRGVVFVQKRATAYVLADMLRSLGEQLSFLRPCAVVGSGGSFRDQQLLFHQFSSGTYNLFIATKSLEDLDMPKVSVVIRFDLFESNVSHAYVRARACGRESHLVYMLERDSDTHRRVLSRITQLDPGMVEWSKRVASDARSSIPPHGLRETTDPYHSDSEDEDRQSQPFIMNPVTGGRIYLQDATTAIYRFASDLAAHPGYGNQLYSHPLFLFQESAEPGCSTGYVCTVSFPAPVMKQIRGPSSPSIAEARRTACFRACETLFAAGVLDCHIFPLSSNVAMGSKKRSNNSLSRVSVNSPQASNAPNPVELGNSGTRLYAQKKPDFWSNCMRISSSNTLYATIVSVDQRETPGARAPMLILTKQPLPAFSPFRIFFSGLPATVRLRQAAPFHIDKTRLQHLHSYTIRLCRAIGNKPFACSVEDMLFFLAPLRNTDEIPSMDDGKSWELPSVEELIPWESVIHAASAWAVPLRCDDDHILEEDMKDAIIQDRWVEFTRRYEVLRLRRDLNPLSKPVDSPREAQYANLLEYCKARRKGFEGLRDNDQPLIEVSRVSPLLNQLSPTSCTRTSLVKAPAKYLIPELCAKFTIPASTFRTAMALPSIMKRIDELLIVKELNAKFFDHNISEDLLHMAVSTPSAGIEYDYERLELLGDAFLKYLSSIYVFVSNPTANEGALHFIRQRLISNKSLLQNASAAGLPEYIQSKPFAIKFWNPINFKLNQSLASVNAPPASELGVSRQVRTVDTGSIAERRSSIMEPGEIPEKRTPGSDASFVASRVGEFNTDIRVLERSRPRKRGRKKWQQGERNTQLLGDKAIADVTEAIIGAGYISGGRETALRVAKALNIPTPNIDQWSDFGRKVLAPHPNVTARLRSGSIEAVEAIIGHEFHRPHLLAQALTHISIHGHETTSYERLEFIGDAILDFMVIRHIFDRDQQLSPGALTLLKGAMVSNSALAAVCIWSGLYEHILSESHHLSKTITTYADQLNILQAVEYRAAESEGRPPGQYWLELEPPKALSDIIESIIGAIYISDNFSPEGAEAFFDNVLKPFFDKHITLRTLSHHPTKTLLELFQAQGCQQFAIVKEKDATLPHCYIVVHDVILADGQDTTASFAARRASISALDALEGDPSFVTRTCDCRSNTANKKPRLAISNVLSGFGEDEKMLIDMSISTNGGALLKERSGRADAV